MKVVRLKPLLSCYFSYYYFLPLCFLLYCSSFFCFFFWSDFFLAGGWGGTRKTFSWQRIFDRTITVAFHLIELFCFCSCFFFFLFFFSRLSTLQHWSGVVVTPRLAHLKLPFNPQFKYMTLMYQQHHEGSFGLVFASNELKRDRFFEADTQWKFKRLLKVGL